MDNNGDNKKMIEISREEFKSLYYKTRDRELAILFGVKDVATIRRYAESLKLQTKGRGYIYPDDKRLQKKVFFV